ncbi:hypothetical protein NX059_011931 [Plenodomus lindquistii]|nr:hypothetical protein NX059_011931 [Plenodomus lindquistii]
MTRTLSVRPKKAGPTQGNLTEENLRAHSCPSREQQQSKHHDQTSGKETDNFDYECDEDEDEQSIAIRRRKASLQALEAYGGCFASGFLAMQQPLPWTTTSMSERRSVSTDSSASSNDAEYVQSESDTQGDLDVQEIQAGGRRSCRDFGKKRLSLMKPSRT